MINEVFIEQKERVEPTSPDEIKAQVSKAHALFFQAMNKKYVTPLDAPLNGLGERREDAGVHYYQNSKQLFSMYADRYVAIKVKPAVTHRIMNMIADSKVKRVRVTGKKEWRFQVWLYGSLHGIQVQGYEPSQRDRQVLDFVRENENAIREVKVKGKENQTKASDPGAPSPEGAESQGRASAGPHQPGSEGRGPSQQKTQGSSKQPPGSERARHAGRRKQGPLPVSAMPAPKQTALFWDYLTRLRLADGDFYRDLTALAPQLPNDQVLKELRDLVPTHSETGTYARAVLQAVGTSAHAAYYQDLLTYAPPAPKEPGLLREPVIEHQKMMREKAKAASRGNLEKARSIQVDINHLEAEVFARSTKASLHVGEAMLNEGRPLQLSEFEQQVLDEQLDPERWSASVRGTKLLAETRNNPPIPVFGPPPEQPDPLLSRLAEWHGAATRKGSLAVEAGRQKAALWFQHQQNLIELEMLHVAGKQTEPAKVYTKVGEPLALMDAQRDWLQTMLTEAGQRAEREAPESGSPPKDQSQAPTAGAAEKTQKRERSDSTEDGASDPIQQKQQTALSDYILLPDPEQNAAAQAALQKLAALSNLPKGDSRRAEVFGDIVDQVAKLEQHNDRKLLLVLEDFFTEDMVDAYVQAKMAAKRRADHRQVQDMSPRELLETLAEQDPLSYGVIADTLKHQGAATLLSQRHQHLKDLPADLQMLGEALFARIEALPTAFTDGVLDAVATTDKTQKPNPSQESTAAPVSRPNGKTASNGPHPAAKDQPPTTTVGQIPVCVTLLGSANPKAIEAVRELVVVYGKELGKQKASFNAAMQQHLDNHRPNQRRLSDQLYQLICNHFDHVVPQLFENTDPEALREKLLQRFENKLKDINAQLATSGQATPSKELLRVKQSHQAWQARLAQGLPFVYRTKQAGQQPRMA
ncbi:LPD7 domain-containing protein [Acanthopleuribacter pedis]|uniref:Large polyvalent protein-associated domain-containing protein n=1 Tax=Acanthopleuribacter pedis TaxID=442870 RepID=A0A8J7QFW5_9BACT|nr:LPD7 domain-containing protein [Acanthopleuribacter pedis]MBO1323389.1 hypothetical protein [Acanthopleuribacter pedis]